MRYTFKAYERLKREQHIKTLFREGKAFSVSCLRILYRVVPRQQSDRSFMLAGFSVPKKKFPGSVQRHRIRRLMVEAWRLGKHTLTPAVPPGLTLHVFFIYTPTTMPTYDEVAGATAEGIKKMANLLAGGRNYQSSNTA